MYRTIAASIQQTLKQNHPPIVLIVGLRQTGKSTLAQSLVSSTPVQLFNFDLISDREEFLNQNRHTLAEFARRYAQHTIIIDEVQKCPEATNIIKHLYDQHHLRFLLTGSSELKITKHVGDSLAGRIKQYRLYPLSLKELLIQRGAVSESSSRLTYDLCQPILSSYLVYGSLPKLENISVADHTSHLFNLSEGLLTTDILELEQIKKSTKIVTLAKLLAQQIGQLVNIQELSTLTELSRVSIYRYLDIFEQLNIICRAYPLSTNNRRAISAKFKVYFTDLGIRNALVNAFNPIQSRLDTGPLLENAVYIGIKRTMEYTIPHAYDLGFFRDRNGSELDIVLRHDGKEQLYEIKSSPKYMNKKGIVTYITMQNAWEYL